ncbi:MAG: hypothetical protein KC964_24685, partial [Candidatus Omnitrophica bacterium]|nr:hypothetical protein [Candidatus Omnitrophota bacterium]
MSVLLFPDNSPVAIRQPKTDRLILARLVEGLSKDQEFRSKEVTEAHGILVRWADFYESGRLGTLTETQLQGDFLSEVFGKALGYGRAVENEDIWHYEQHRSIGGSTPDAVLGRFEQDADPDILGVIELKGPTVHLDRDRSGGRTAVEQCWDYLVDTPTECRWGIVSNMVSFRLYERNSTRRAYEHFTLQSLRDINVFRQFYALFHRKGLIEWTFKHPPRAVALLEQTQNRQREVSDELYDAYSENRTRLISELHHRQGLPLDDAIEMTQRLLDRVFFIAFCEDRGLLPEKTISKAYKVNGFQAVTNPRWQSFKNLFRIMNTEGTNHDIPYYNGGLFAPHAVDDLELDDNWTGFFTRIGEYDFGEEVNLEVLGHLFERSITEIEKLKESNFFAGDADKAEEFATMPQSIKRKHLGVYYTPRELTSLVVEYTIEELIRNRFKTLAVDQGVSKKEAEKGVVPETKEYWSGCLDILRNLKIVDPACGSGAFLFQAYNLLEQAYQETIDNLGRVGGPGASDLMSEVPHFILNENIYGVDL